MSYSQHNSEPENLLWKMTVNNDEKAFEKIFSLFYPVLFMFAKKYIEEQHAREDIVQDIFVSLWEDRKKLTINTSLRNYLLVAVRNNCINYLRKEKLILQYQGSVLNNSFSTSDEENAYTLTELKRLLEEALDKLPENYRIVFEMHRMEGIKHEEIAEKLNISVRTVKRYQSQAIEELKKSLKDYLPLVTLYLFH